MNFRVATTHMLRALASYEKGKGVKPQGFGLAHGAPRGGVIYR